MKNIKAYIKRIYRLSLNFKNHESLIWKDLKKMHSDAKWQSGVFENEKYIETVFEIAEKKPGIFYYMIFEGEYHCRVKIIEDFSSDLTSDIFILAAHFNNLLKSGKVVVNVQNQFVEYHLKTNGLITLLYQGEIYNQLMAHYNISKDIYWAYEQLIEKNEEPLPDIKNLFSWQYTPLKN